MLVPHLDSSLATKAFSNMKKNAEKMRFERSGLMPKNVEEYSKLKKWYRKVANDKKESKMEQNMQDLVVAGVQHRGIVLLFDGKIIGDGNVGVLGLPTIWARHWTASSAHPAAPWPCPQEFREEGDERHTSNYGRFLPIPRVPGNPTVTFKHKSWNPVEELDKVMPVPKLYAAANLNHHGMFDVTVDEEGNPYDDKDLPGNEYVVKKEDIAANDIAGTNSFAKNDQRSGATTLLNKGSNGHNVPLPRASRLRAMAAPFVSCVKKEEEVPASKISFDDCMTNMKAVFGKINAGHAAEQENSMNQVMINMKAVFEKINARRLVEQKSLLSKAISETESAPNGDIDGKKPVECKEGSSSAAKFESERSLISMLKDLFNTLNGGKAVGRENSSAGPDILQANINTPSSRRSSVSEYTSPGLNASPHVDATLSSLGLFASEEFPPIYAENKAV